MKLPLYCLAALVCMPLAAQATMYKCKLPNGSSTYQDAPCANGSEGTVAHVSAIPLPSGSEPPQAGDGPAMDMVTPVVGANTYSTSVNQPGPQIINRRVIVERKVVRVWVEPRHVEPVRRVERSTSSGTSRSTSTSHATAHR